MRLLLPLLLAGLTAAGQEADLQRESNNRIYRSERHLFRTTAGVFLPQALTGRHPGTALDVAMGQGRNALWLAGRGWKVTGFDISDAALSEARAQARERGLNIETVLSRYEVFDFGTEKWDLIVLAYFFPRDVVPKVVTAIRPGGLVLLEYYHKDAQRTRLIDGTDLEELSRLFEGWQVLRYEVVHGQHEWGLTLGTEQPVVRFLVQKPGPRATGCSWKDKPAGVGGTVCWDERNILMKCAAAGWEYAGACNAGK
jgi:2-polyprenyl-3-methyl-5-hydroxy-6-metoxy-1,4-benzoquinol methylase